MTFAKRLKESRTNKDYTQEELATMIGIAKSTLAGYEKGNREPDFTKLIKLTEILEVTSDYLLGISDNKNVYDLSRDEKLLIEKYNKLNFVGQERVHDFIDSNMLTMDRYLKEPSKARINDDFEVLAVIKKDEIIETLKAEESIAALKKDIINDIYNKNLTVKQLSVVKNVVDVF